MSIIAVNGIPISWTLAWAAKTLQPSIKGRFEALKFSGIGRMSIKTCYIQLPDTLDPVRVVEEITRFNFGKVRLKAFIPKPQRLPNFNVPPKKPKQKKKQKGKKKWGTFNDSPNQIVQYVHMECLMEIQYKYPALFNLSLKTGHKLLETIARKIFDRLKPILSMSDINESCFRITSMYRKTYPHKGDCQLIVDTLHALQDASGAPRTPITEKDLLRTPMAVNELTTRAEINKATGKYSNKIVEAITAHIDALDSKPTQLDNEHETARKKVRQELKKMMPYLPLILKQVVAKHFNPQTDPFYMIRIYGEPFLPKKDAMIPFVNRYHAGTSRVIRHPRMYNLLLFKVTKEQYNTLMAVDGTVINGAKLVIRSDQPTYKASDEFRSEMSAAFGGPKVPPPDEIMSFDVAMDENMEDYADDVEMDEQL